MNIFLFHFSFKAFSHLYHGPLVYPLPPPSLFIPPLSIHTLRIGRTIGIFLSSSRIPIWKDFCDNKPNFWGVIDREIFYFQT